jgi:hypothetical protein
MVPFSFKPGLSYSRVMKKTFFDHRSVEDGSLALEIGCPSCLLAFLILISAPAFCLYSVPLCLFGQYAFVSGPAKDLRRF